MAIDYLMQVIVKDRTLSDDERDKIAAYYSKALGDKVSVVVTDESVELVIHELAASSSEGN